MDNLKFDLSCGMCGWKIQLRPDIANRVFKCPKCGTKVNEQFDIPEQPTVHKRQQNKVNKNDKNIVEKIGIEKINFKELPGIIIGLFLLAIFLFAKVSSCGNIQQKGRWPEELAIENPVFKNQVIKNDYSKIDSYVALSNPENENTIGALAKYLSLGCLDEHEKARAIYVWITKNISYDLEALANLNNTNIEPENVFLKKKSVCSGYSRLFCALANKMNVKSTYVGGQVLSSNYFFNFENKGHAWNAVQINGVWHLVDCTWGSGHVAEGKFEKKFEEFFFLTPPLLLSFSHFPDDEKWQLTDDKIKFNEFAFRPEVNLEFLKNGVKYEDIIMSLKINKKLPIIHNVLRKVYIKTAPMELNLKSNFEYIFEFETVDGDLSFHADLNNGKIFLFNNNVNSKKHSLVFSTKSVGVLNIVVSNKINDKMQYVFLKYNVK